MILSVTKVQAKREGHSSTICKFVLHEVDSLVVVLM
jgi:hypothetical protein